MAIELSMPALSPTMEKGTLARWLVNEGDLVKAGDQIAEIETDKATMEFEVADGGRVLRLLVPAGSENVAVGTVIAVLGDAGEVVAETASAAAPVVAEKAAPVAPAPVVAVVEAPVAAAPLVLDRSIPATPLARRVAAIKGVDLGKVQGSGSRGRIVVADLGAAIPTRVAPVAPLAVAAPVIAPPPEGVPVVSEKLSGMRKTIARRLTESKQQVPHFYLTSRCNLDALLALRGELNAGLAGRGVKLSVNDMLIKALALALVAVPDANVQFGGDVLHRFGRVDVSMAVAIPGGLVTPVLRDVASLSLSAIAGQSKALAEKARDGRLTPEDYQGGTVSLSNLGMFGVDEMFPVINPPQALILGTAAGVRQPWDVKGEIALATIMAATASFDHRAIDGAVAAQFMAALRDLIEAPIQLVA
ncbi:dihydrolipoamide acetyltransferase family protein [Novosphingobium terrae]|uniref:dihydrolipoamide acetyltransferase family protein n=1 Tax=Novosphingobium terrae TaxID=2726189 RepID=UPI001981C216|nr:dihydrolipoamide acetyltransferase family protein [Novosphingobium terrae]